MAVYMISERSGQSPRLSATVLAKGTLSRYPTCTRPLPVLSGRDVASLIPAIRSTSRASVIMDSIKDPLLLERSGYS